MDRLTMIFSPIFVLPISAAASSREPMCPALCVVQASTVSILSNKSTVLTSMVFSFQELYPTDARCQILPPPVDTLAAILMIVLIVTCQR